MEIDMYKNELKKIESLMNDSIKTKATCEKPRNLRKIPLMRSIATYDKLLTFLEDYKHYDNFEEIQDFLARKIRNYLPSMFVEEQLSKKKTIKKLNENKPEAPQDIKIDFIIKNKLRTANFDVKVCCLPKSLDCITAEELLNIHNKKAIFCKVFNEMVENAYHKDYFEHKLYFLIKSKTDNKTNEFLYRVNFDLLNETVNKYFDSITTYSGLVRKCKTRNGNYVGAMIIPIIVP